MFLYLVYLDGMARSASFKCLDACLDIVLPCRGIFVESLQLQRTCVYCHAEGYAVKRIIAASTCVLGGGYSAVVRAPDS